MGLVKIITKVLSINLILHHGGNFNTFLILIHINLCIKLKINLSMFARDNAPGWGVSIELIKPTKLYLLNIFFLKDNKNNYGFQPVYLSVEKSGKTHLVLLYNSNAMGKLLAKKFYS